MPGLKLALLLGIRLFTTVESPAPGAPIGSEPPVLALEYVQGSEVPECMGERELRGRLRSQLGYDPFATEGGADHRETLRIEIGRRRGVLVADLTLIGSDGVQLAQQRLRSGESNCASLGAALEVAVSVMFDRAEEPKKPPPTEAELLALSPAPFPEISLPAAPAPPKPPIHLWAGVLVAWAADLRPEAVLQISVRPATWSLDIEARYEHLDSVDQVGTRWTVAIAPCIWTGSGSGLGFCPVLMGGVLSITGANGPSESGSLPELATGARLAVAAPLWGPVALRLQGGVVFPLISTSTTVNGMQLTEPMVMTLDFGAGLSVQLL